MIYCDNCGRPSHCGIPLWEDYKDEYWGKRRGQIKVCDHCRCDKCTEKDDQRTPTK